MTGPAAAPTIAPGPEFAIVGPAGYVAPRHLDAIRSLGGRLIFAHDISENVRILDTTFPDAAFTTSLDEFEDWLASSDPVAPERFVSICSPNHLHRRHVEVALNAGWDAICEKPLVLDPAQLDELRDIERRTGRRVWTILQLRLLPALVELHDAVAADGSSRRASVELKYVTPRGRWYFRSWKGDEDLSGGIVTNIGIHLLDLIQWVFGRADSVEVVARGDRFVSGRSVHPAADVRWFLSVDEDHLPEGADGTRPTAHRSLDVDGAVVDFGSYGRELHLESYRRILRGEGFGIAESEPSIRLAHLVRTSVAGSGT